MISSKFSQLLELGCVFVQLSSLHLEFKELLLGLFSAHDILEVLGKVIDHSVPDPFVHFPSSCAQVSVQLGGYLLDPKVHLWSPKVSKEEHCSGHWVVHYPSLFVDPLIDTPAGHKFLHLITVSSENFWFLADHLV